MIQTVKTVERNLAIMPKTLNFFNYGRIIVVIVIIYVFHTYVHSHIYTTEVTLGHYNYLTDLPISVSINLAPIRQQFKQTRSETDKTKKQ